MNRILAVSICFWLIMLPLLLPGSGRAQTPDWQSDIPLLQQQHLSADYWLAKLPQAQQLLLDAQQIRAFNQRTFAVQPEMQPIAEIPLSHSRQQLLERLDKVSSIPGSARFFADGRAMAETDWLPLQAALNRDGIEDINPTRFALVTRRSLLLAFPTTLRIFNDAMALDLNRLQETAVFVGEPLAVLHQTADQQWSLVQNYHYTGWVETSVLAIGERQQILAYAAAEPFLVITGARAHTNFNPELAAISELQLDMGVRLPLLTAAQTGHQVHGQNPHASYIVQLPKRSADGALELVPALIARNQDVSVGYLPYTTEQLLRQAFKYLGQRYGWGYDYNSVDCTGLLVDIFRTFGLLMPRNSGEQGYGDFGQNQRFAEDLPVADKLALLKSAQVGDLLYRPGHVMIYLGESGGEPFVLHSVFDLAYYQQDGHFYRGTLNGVAVTPLAPLYLTAEQNYLHRLYNIKSLR